MNSINIKGFILNKRSIVLTTLFLLGGYICSAQSKRAFTFTPGDEFEKQSILKSTANIQRGNQRLTVSSSSNITRLYKVTEVDTAAKMDVTITKMDNIISALGQLLHYDSEKGVDSTSKIQKSLGSMLNKPVKVSVNKNGKIVSSDESALQTINDSLIVFAGIQSEPFIVGNQFNLTPNFTVSERIKPGYAWLDTVKTDQQQMITRFWIDDVTYDHTVVKFQSKLTSTYMNSNTTGTYVVDNYSGMIVQRLVQSISNGYQVMNSLVYVTNRSISLSEEVALRPVKGRGPTPIDPDMTVKAK
ncbi:MAG: hypothetical protein EOP47_05300 [Sphingobacteriaceae bacterium]|nr:MAG: hypothetical protein EOP47_05300 [Sphingobacteriaceae bacterium]